MGEIKIGKNAIENLTRAMYEDSKIIYREYIQNAADQIDYAIKHTLFKEELFIDIQIDKSGRNLTIKDNATGVRREMIESTLAYVADSDKVKGETKGFRGIGRLGGLAYCDRLRFITTAKGESQRTIMTWDAKALNIMLDDDSVKDDAGSLLQKIISYEWEDCPVDDHYFIVELLGITNENMELLDTEKVKEYISLNAPVPYDSKFYYKQKIYEYLQNKALPRNEYKIYVDGEDILKMYTTSLFEKNPAGQRRKYDDIYDVRIQEFYNENDELLAWMWYGISRFEKQIPHPLNETAGIRVRQSNIQIGNERTLIPFFKEARGNLYFIGEVHAVHKDLTPNARRDYFNENSSRNDFEARLKYFCNTELHSVYNDANRAKNAFKKEIILHKKEDEYTKKAGRFVSDREKQMIEHQIETAKSEDIKAKKDIDRLKAKAKNDDVFSIILKHIEDKHNKTLEDEGLSDHTSQPSLSPLPSKEPTPKKKKGYLVDELTSFPDKQKKLVSRIYDVIARNLPPEQSEELINKIQEELKNGKKNSTN
ncbi:ATP-binding protein [Desulfosporosinus sp. FKA]|uniref:ATP-binding protein n=1 Tax=Desulfosporosinus sp. FKA TaxID=1969834 RepID=UPI000B49D100|nr:ATP-binding protein [Desulfosporosinus sp. FKA]